MSTDVDKQYVTKSTLAAKNIYKVAKFGTMVSRTIKLLMYLCEHDSKQILDSGATIVLSWCVRAEINKVVDQLKNYISQHFCPLVWYDFPLVLVQS